LKFDPVGRIGTIMRDVQHMDSRWEDVLNMAIDREECWNELRFKV